MEGELKWARLIIGKLINVDHDYRPGVSGLDGLPVWRAWRAWMACWAYGGPGWPGGPRWLWVLEEYL